MAEARAPEPTQVEVSETGRLVLPAEYRRAIGLTGPGRLMLSLEDGELRLRSAPQGVAEAQALFRRYVPEGRMISEELIAARREEARREEEGG